MPDLTGDLTVGRERNAPAPFSAGLTWPVILERAMEDARDYRDFFEAHGGAPGDVMLDTEGHMRLAYDRGQQDERAAILAALDKWTADREWWGHDAVEWAARQIEKGAHHA